MVLQCCLQRQVRHAHIVAESCKIADLQTKLKATGNAECQLEGSKHSLLQAVSIWQRPINIPLFHHEITDGKQVKKGPCENTNQSHLEEFVSNMAISSGDTDLPGCLLSGWWVLAICISTPEQAANEGREICQTPQDLNWASGFPEYI